LRRTAHRLNAVTALDVTHKESCKLKDQSFMVTICDLLVWLRGAGFVQGPTISAWV